ncbi:MAG TPA: AMP-binding protein [Mycobacteriales bacterium]|nr:AMP-binding protein [Mycobacteriales bacterium]
MPASADLHQPAFMPDLLVAALNRHADKPAVYLGDEVLTAAEVAAEMSRYQQAYASLGIGEHHPIAMLSKNRPEVLFTMGANMLTPCRSTSLHPMGSLDDQAYVLEDAGVETLVFDPSAFEERAAELRDKVPGLKTLLSLGPAEVGTDLIELAKAFSPQPLVAPVVDPEEVTGLTYTGGTTGKSKGVMQTYRSGATLTQIQLAEWEWPEEVRFLIATPLSHAGAAFFVPTLLRGGSIVVLPGFDPTAVLEAIQKYRITATMLVPTMLYILMDHPKLDDYDLSSLQTVYYGAAAISPTRLKEAIERFGPIFFQFFGQSECGMTISVLKKDEHDTSDMARLATCGRAVPWLKVALLDDEFNEVPDGEPGEICVRGPLVMKGYWNKPEQTAEALAGGWLHTGDIARKDAQGFLTIVDRKKDMIVSGGFNVFPREVEDVIGTHPAVAQVAVIGVPDEKWGEAVKAVVVCRPDQTVDADDLISLVKDRKGAVHAPKSVDFVDAIPLSALGKPDKKALRAQYWQGTERAVN